MVIPTDQPLVRRGDTVKAILLGERAMATAALDV
jgi:hypothetical protein